MRQIFQVALDVLHALLLPVRLMILVYWDIRCQWFGKHKWYHAYRLETSQITGKRYVREYDVCRNFYCRCIRLGSEKRQPFWAGEEWQGVSHDGQK